MKATALAILALALAAMTVGCGPRDHLGPGVGDSLNSIYQAQREATGDPLAPLSADVAQAIRAAYVQSFVPKGMSGGMGGGGIGGGTGMETGMMFPALESGGDKQITLSPE